MSSLDLPLEQQLLEPWRVNERKINQFETKSIRTMKDLLVKIPIRHRTREYQQLALLTFILSLERKLIRIEELQVEDGKFPNHSRSDRQLQIHLIEVTLQWLDFLSSLSQWGGISRIKMWDSMSLKDCSPAKQSEDTLLGERILKRKQKKHPVPDNIRIEAWLQMAQNIRFTQSTMSKLRAHLDLDNMKRQQRRKLELSLVVGIRRRL